MEKITTIIKLGEVKMARIKSKDDVEQRFYRPDEKDLQILCFGYNDFETLEPNKYYHVKDRFTLHYVINGNGTLCIENKKYTVKEKEFFLVPMNVKIAYYPNPKNKWAYVWFNYIGDFAESFNSSLNLSQDSPIRSVEENFDESNLFELVHKLNKVGELGYYDVLSVFYSCANILTLKNHTTTQSEKLIIDAKKIVDLNYMDSDFSIESITKLLHVSHSYLIKVFKEKTGQTLINYLLEKRLKKAGELLRETSFSAKEIAYTVGYNDDVHFLKKFKEYYGKTTKEYRKNN